MVENKPCNNLDTSRTPRWLIIINFLISLVPQEINFQGIRLFGIFNFFDISKVLGVPKLETWGFKSQSLIIKILFWVGEIIRKDDSKPPTSV